MTIEERGIVEALASEAERLSVAIKRGAWPDHTEPFGARAAALRSLLAEVDALAVLVADMERERERKRSGRRRGGLKGGKARAASLTPERRSEIARNAARARWGES